MSPAHKSTPPLDGDIRQLNRRSLHTRLSLGQVRVEG
jgi:hypothetical protein